MHDTARVFAALTMLVLTLDPALSRADAHRAQTASANEGVSEESLPLQTRIERALAAFDNDASPGAVVLVTRDGQTIAEHAAGMANLEHGQPLTTASVFHVASDAKRFTAAAICRLGEWGQLSLEDAVSRHIPESAPLGDRLTIKQLLCHSSGLKDQWSLLAMAGWQPEDVVTHDQVVELLCRQRSTNFEPGDRQMYSNSGYTLLAEIVFRVTGSKLDAFLEREFFAPCGMSQTRARASFVEIVPGRVESYRRSDTDTYVRRPVQYEVLGATSLLTSAADLARWIEAVHAGVDAIRPSELETMLSSRWLPNGDKMTYAFGLHEHDVHGLTAVGHGGADGGFRSYFLRIPESRLGVIVLANTPEIDTNGLAHQIAEWALEIEPPRPNPTSFEEASSPELDELVGAYLGADGRVVTVRRWFDKLRVWNDAAPSDFVWTAEKAVFVDPAGRTLAFDHDRCEMRTPDATWSGDRMARPAGDELRAFEGRYLSEELGALYRVGVVGDALIARSPRGPRITLSPTGGDFFDGDAWYCFEARFARDENDRVRGMYVSSGRAFDVFFERMPPGWD